MNSTKALCLAASVLLSGLVGYQLGSRNGDEPKAKLAEPNTHTKAIETVGTPINPIHDQIEPEALTLQAILNAKHWGGRHNLTTRYFSEMNKANVDRYLADLEALPPSVRKTGLMGMFFAKWGELEGQTAYDYAMSTKGRDRNQFLTQAAAGWAKIEPLKAWDAAMELTGNGKNFTVSIHSVLSAIAEKDLRTAMNLTQSIQSNATISFGSGSPSSIGLATLVHVVSQNGDFAELSKILMEESEPNSLGASLDTLFGAWGVYEFDGPLAAIKEIKDPELAKQAMTGFMKGWAQADGGEAFQYAINNQDDSTIAAALPDIASIWIQSATADEIAGIVSRLDAVENRDEVASKLIYTVGRTDPHLAMNMAVGMEDPKKREQNVRNTTSQWARQNVDEADAYIRSIADENLRLAASSTLLNQHISQNSPPEKVLSFVDGFSDEKSRTRVLLTLVANATSDQNRAKAQPLKEALAASIATRADISEGSRKSLLERLAKN